MSRTLSRILVALAALFALRAPALAHETGASCVTFMAEGGTHCSSCPAHSVEARDHDEDDDDDGQALHYPRLARARNAIHRDHDGDCPKCARSWEATGERRHAGDDCDHCVSPSKVTRQCCWEAARAGKACEACGPKSSPSCCMPGGKPKIKEEGAMCAPGSANCGS